MGPRKSSIYSCKGTSLTQRALLETSRTLARTGKPKTLSLRLHRR